jgi:hypothetical protein
MFFTYTWRAASRLNTQELHQDIRQTFPIVFPLALCVLTFFGYMSYFARSLYSEIPFAIGGGKPQTISVLVKQNHDRASAPVVLEQLGGARSIPYRLVLETDLTYTVLSGVPKEGAIQLNRDSVAGYIILEP